VTLINLTGLALFGPGSEWLWAMIQSVVLIVTLLAIYRQVRAQRAANELGQVQELMRAWHEETFLRSRLAALTQIRESNVVLDLTPDMARVANFFDDLAIQQGLGRLSAHLVWEFFGREVQFWWLLLQPSLVLNRETTGEPGSWTRVDALFQRVRETQRVSGVHKWDPEIRGVAAATIDRKVLVYRTQLAHLRDARTGVVPPPPHVAQAPLTA